MQKKHKAKGAAFAENFVSGLRWYGLGVMLMVVLLFLQYRLWFESNGINDMVKLKNVLAVQAQENDKLKKQNEELLFQIQRLQNSQEASESRARNELGMIKKDEKFYHIVH